MIHVAPCSCELHIEIRRLEKKLHMEQMRVHDLKQDMEEGLDYLRVREQQLELEKARAEKAQAAETRIRQKKAENDLFWSAKVNELQARVAELVEEINLIIRHYKIEDYDLSVLRESQEVYRYKDGRTIPVVRERKPAPAIEGHEREAD